MEKSELNQIAVLLSYLQEDLIFEVHFIHIFISTFCKHICHLLEQRQLSISKFRMLNPFKCTQIPLILIEAMPAFSSISEFKIQNSEIGK